MASDEDRPGRPSRGYTHEGYEGTAVHVTDERQAARWRSLSVRLPDVDVRERIRRGLASIRRRDPIVAGSETVRGFVIKFRNGRHLRVADLELTTWEGGTQVHVALPAEYKAKDLAVLTNWLRPVLGILGAAE